KNAPTLRVTVNIAPELAQKRRGDQVLYVFAKAAEGPPMPLAVRKLRPDKWPGQVTLDDSLAMSPALRLSMFDTCTVIARFGADGAAMAQCGDVQGHTSVTRAQSDKTIDVLISETVP